MLKESNPYLGQLNYVYIFEILHRIAEANKQPNCAETYLDYTKLNDIENEFNKAMIKVQSGSAQPSQPDTTLTTTTKTIVKQPAEQTTKGRNGGKTKVSSKEKTKKKSAENAKKKIEDNNKKLAQEILGKKAKTKFKSAEHVKDNKLKMKSKEAIKEKKKPKSGENGGVPKVKSNEKQSSLPLDKTQPIPTPLETPSLKSTQSFE
uniref:Uncharacterized protein n=1 Tax=Panagrolaimus davidi TaxID=227884 RepID=A0A914QUU4_9BILA